jgi:hypothetical protein
VRALLSPWFPCILFAAVILIGIPLLCWFAGDEPRNDDDADSPARQEDGPLSLAA